MPQKIICDSYSPDYDSRLTTFLIYIPYIHLLDFYKYPYINISYKIMKEKKYKPSYYKNDSIKDYYYSSILDFSKSLGECFVINTAISYCAVILTSSKWGSFFYDIRNSAIHDVHDSDFITLIDEMESNYIDSSKSAKSLKTNEWHLPLNYFPTGDMPTKLAFSFYNLHNFDTRKYTTTNEIYAKRFLKENIKYENRSIFNHIAKVADNYTYLENGLFDKKWDKKKKGFNYGYNSIYDTWICLYDILKQILGAD